MLMYEYRTQNYDLEMHKVYLIHDTPVPRHFIYSELSGNKIAIR